MNPTKPTTLPLSLQKIIEEGREDPVIFAEELLGMRLHRGQKRWLRSTSKKKKKINILLPANRWGKSTVTGIKHIWKHFYKIGIPEGNQEAWMKSEYRTANVAPNASLVEAVFKVVDQVMTSSFPIRQEDGSIITNKCLIEWFYLSDRTTGTPDHPPIRQFFAFGSYIEHRTIGATASDSLEGRPYGYISYDEGGRSRNLESEINGTFLARLFDWDGDLDIPSTPSQTSPSILYHYKLYNNGLHEMNETYTMKGQLSDNTFFTKPQIAKQYSLYEANPLRDQVLLGKFVFGGDNMFGSDDILAAETDTLNDGIRYIPGHKYAIGTDSAIGSDEMVHSVLDVTNLRIIKENDLSGERITHVEGEALLVKQLASKGNAKSPQRHLNDFIDLCEHYGGPDRDAFEHMLETWNGESVRFYKDLPYWIQTRTKCYGSWQPQQTITDNENKPKTTNKDAKKADILMALSKLLTGRALKIFSIDPNPPIDPKFAPLTQELSIYREDDAKIPTDRVISLALASWIALNSSALTTKTLAFIDM